MGIPWTSLRLTIQGIAGLQLWSKAIEPYWGAKLAESCFCSSFLPSLALVPLSSLLYHRVAKPGRFDASPASPQHRPGSIRDGTQCHAHRCRIGFLRSNGGIEPWYCWKRSATTLGSIGQLGDLWGLGDAVMETNGEGLIVGIQAVPRWIWDISGFSWCVTTAFLAPKLEGQRL